MKVREATSKFLFNGEQTASMTDTTTGIMFVVNAAGENIDLVAIKIGEKPQAYEDLATWGMVESILPRHVWLSEDWEPVGADQTITYWKPKG